MATNLATSSEYEAEANRLRAQIGVTVGALRSGLTPSNLASEAVARVGMADLSWGGAFDYASKRHPVPTAIIGLGIALWTMSAVRNRGRRDQLAVVTAPLEAGRRAERDWTGRRLRDARRFSARGARLCARLLALDRTR